MNCRYIHDCPIYDSFEPSDCCLDGGAECPEAKEYALLERAFFGGCFNNPGLLYNGGEEHGVLSICVICQKRKNVDFDGYCQKCHDEIAERNVRLGTKP